MIAKTIEVLTLLMLKSLRPLQRMAKRSITFFNLYSLQSIFFFDRVSSTLVVPYLTDRSCCGGLNASIWATLTKFLYVSALKNFIIHLHGTGRRIINKWTSRFNVLSRYVSIVGNLYYLSEETSTFYLAFILSKTVLFLDYRVFYVVYSKFINSLNQKVMYINIISFYLFTSVINGVSYIGLPYCKDMLYSIYLYSMCMLLLDVICNTSFSELGSRLSAMKNIVTLSRERLDYYTVISNRMRQSRITTGIIEIVSAVTSVSGASFMSSDFFFSKTNVS
jgi:F-type H+-transporting ATPase subunit gamma